MPDIKVLAFQQQQMKQQQQQQQQSQQTPQQQQQAQPKKQLQHKNVSGSKPGTAAASSLGSDTDRSATSSSNQTVELNHHEAGERSKHHEVGERAKHVGTLFERKPAINQEIFDEFFRREPCHYSTPIFPQSIFTDSYQFNELY